MAKEVDSDGRLLNGKVLSEESMLDLIYRIA